MGMVVDIQADQKVLELTTKYAWLATAEMVAIPVPGLDLAAVFGTWVKMIQDIAPLYGYEVSREDAERLAGDLVKCATLSGCAWVGSTTLASVLLKFMPGAGTVAKYLIDAAVAGTSIHKITAGLATVTALYFKTGRSFAPRTFADSMKKVVTDPDLILSVLATVALHGPLPVRPPVPV
jgi:uncharacterized protein (DUF697 family)